MIHLWCYTNLCILYFLLFWCGHFYHPPMKLGEGNAFTCVCQSFCPQGLGIPGPISFPRGGYLWYQVPSGVVGLFWGGYLPSPRTWEQRQGVGMSNEVGMSREGWVPPRHGTRGCGYVWVWVPAPILTFYTQDRWGCQNIALTPLVSCT